jgi:hypothetical protein
MYLPVSPDNNLIFQKDLCNLSAWAQSNDMSFNISKCHSIFFGKAADTGPISHSLCGEQLTKTSSIKYLGVTITDDLKWEEHITNTVSKSNRALGLLKRVLYKTPQNIKLTAYKVMCRSILEFASEVWDPFLKKDIHRLEMVQNRAVRFICDLRGVCSVSEAREGISLESLETRRTNNSKGMLLNIIGGRNCPPALESAFPELSLAPSPLHTTRAVTSGIPAAVTCSTSMYLNSFISRTTRELRLNFLNF